MMSQDVNIPVIQSCLYIFPRTSHVSVHSGLTLLHVCVSSSVINSREPFNLPSLPGSMKTSNVENMAAVASLQTAEGRREPEVISINQTADRSFLLVSFLLSRFFGFWTGKLRMSLQSGFHNFDVLHTKLSIYS